LYAALKRLLPFGEWGCYQTFQKESEAACRTALPTCPTPSRDVMRLMELRALRLNNRSPKAAAKYLQKHLILHKGRCSDVGLHQ
jgi:hypothetical protein